MSLIIFYDNTEVKPKKMYRVLSYVPYSLIENNICIEYLSCQSKTFCTISSNRIFKQTSFNILLGIGIPEQLLNLLSCHGFMHKSNTIVILNCRSHLVNNHLENDSLLLKRTLSS